MQVPDYALPTAAERTTPSFPGRPNLAFTRALFRRNGSVHTESRCNQCGFKITGTTSDSRDNEEQEHARDCQGSWME